MSGDEETVYEVPEGINKLRADKALHMNCPELSRSQVQRLFDQGRVWLDNAAIRKSAKVSAGDSLVYSIPPVEPLDLEPVNIPLTIIYEDEDIIAVNKACGMVVHPGSGTGKDTLVHALLYHCQGQLSGIGGVERPGIVHRLDKETTGVIVAAKTDRAFSGLSQAFEQRHIHKVYRALVSGVPELKSGTIKEPIGRHPVHRHKMAVNERGRSAHSEWECIEAFGDVGALLEVTIHTGRTHQIRVHLSHIGHPIMGDKVYGYRKREDSSVDPERVMLHAHRLEFKHPVSKEKISLVAELPEDFSTLLSQLRE